MKKIIYFAIGLIAITIIFVSAVSAEDAVAGSSGSINVDNSLALKIREKEIKIKKIEAFLKSYNSPLESYASSFVDKAEEYNIDWKLVVSILGVESTFGKNIPVNSYNGWGWGIPTGASSGLGFKDWKDGIDQVSKGLREKYIERELDTVYKMGHVYAPPSKTWAGNVNLFMDKLEATVVVPELSI